MTASVLLLDPDLPICWEDPRTIRVGFDRAVARLHRPGAGVQRLLVALRAGVRDDRLDELALSIRTTRVEVDRALVDLEPAILRRPAGADGRMGASPPRAPLPVRSGPEHRKPLLVRLSDDGRSVPAIENALSSSGCCTLVDSKDLTTRCDLVVLVERFFEPLERSSRWLHAETPLLVVRFTDGGFQVGPLVSAQGAPCLSCIALGAVEVDPGLPALAAQLTGARAAGESPAATEVAAAVAMSFIRRWRDGDGAVHRSRIVLRVHRGRVTGSPEFETVPPHPECACGMLAQLAGDQSRPASERNREAVRPDRPPLAVPERRSASRARVKAT